jgi:hypothetical protein
MAIGGGTLITLGGPVGMMAGTLILKVGITGEIGTIL